MMSKYTFFLSLCHEIEGDKQLWVSLPKVRSDAWNKEIYVCIALNVVEKWNSVMLINTFGYKENGSMWSLN